MGYIPFKEKSVKKEKKLDFQNQLIIHKMIINIFEIHSNILGANLILFVN